MTLAYVKLQKVTNTPIKHLLIWNGLPPKSVPNSSSKWLVLTKTQGYVLYVPSVPIKAPLFPFFHKEGTQERENSLRQLSDTRGTIPPLNK